MKPSALVTLALASALSSTVWAHAHLRTPSPAADSTVAAPSELRLSFSEGVEPAFSDVTLVNGSGATVKTQLHRAEGDDSVLVAEPVSPLGTGSWEVQWKVVSVDTHRSEGHYRFTVK
jgi:methionine-rich copper-binding protein CopC